MSTYTIDKVLGSEEWSGNNGQMRTYEILLQGENRTVSLTRKASSQPPSEGETLDGTISDSPKGRNFKVDRQNGAGGRSGGGGKNFDRSPDHPVQMQRALHTSALSSAIPLIEQMFTFGLSDVPKPTTKDEYLKLVEGVATWVQQSYPQAVLDQAAKADAETA